MFTLREYIDAICFDEGRFNLPSIVEDEEVRSSSIFFYTKHEDLVNFSERLHRSF